MQRNDSVGSVLFVSLFSAQSVRCRSESRVPASSTLTVKTGQDLAVGKVWYQKVRFLSEGWYQTFPEQRSGTKKCEKTLQMVRMSRRPKFPDQIERFSPS